jgi:hypothetical protein
MIPGHHVMNLPCCTSQDSSAACKNVLYRRSLLSHPLQTTAKLGQRSPVTGVQSVQLCAERASTLNLWSPYRCSSVSSFQSLAARHVSHSPVMTTGSRGRSNRSTKSSTLSSCLGTTPAHALHQPHSQYHDLRIYRSCASWEGASFVGNCMKLKLAFCKAKFVVSTTPL